MRSLCVVFSPSFSFFYWHQLILWHSTVFVICTRTRKSQVDSLLGKPGGKKKPIQKFFSIKELEETFKPTKFKSINNGMFNIDIIHVMYMYPRGFINLNNYGYEELFY